jgi:hypothetical protein
MLDHGWKKFTIVDYCTKTSKETCVFVTWQSAFSPMGIFLHERRHDLINPYGISLYNHRDLRSHEHVVIGFIFTYAARDQLAANLFHE